MLINYINLFHSITASFLSYIYIYNPSPFLKHIIFFLLLKIFSNCKLQFFLLYFY